VKFDDESEDDASYARPEGIGVGNVPGRTDACEVYHLEKRSIVYRKQKWSEDRTSVPAIESDPEYESNPTRTSDRPVLDEIPPQKREHRKLVLPYTSRHKRAEPHNQHYNDTSFSPFLTLISRKCNCEQYKCEARSNQNHSNNVELEE
jgi:hypothetical protein